MDIEKIYNQLTNIDIREQKQIWDERGKGYYGEYLLFCELYGRLAGQGKILMNLNIPVDNNKTTEIDLLLIHETGLYVFEIKHYKGTIYGKDDDEFWTQYFRTTRNSIFRNPIEQNGYHVRALKKIFPNVPIHSLVVFTSNECNIKVENRNREIDICLLPYVYRVLVNRFQLNKNTLYSMETIDKMFVQLSAYSQMKKEVIIDKKEATFFSWIQPIISELEKRRAMVEQEKNNWSKESEKIKKAKRKGILFNVAVAIACIVVSAFISTNIVNEYRIQYDSAIQKNNTELNAFKNELAEFKQNFLHVNEIGNEYIDELNSYVEVSDVSLKPLTDDAVSFSAKLTMSNDTYGLALTENSKYVVITDSGTVFEYDVFGQHLAYNRYYNIIGKGYRFTSGDLKEIQFYGISNVNNISYIKVTNIELLKLDINKTVIKDKLEIELYSK